MKVQLSFKDKLLESEYVENFTIESVDNIRFGYYVSFLGWLWVPFWTWLNYREHLGIVLLLQFGILYPLFMVALIVIGSEKRKGYSQAVGALGNALAAIIWLVISYYIIQDELFLVGYYIFIVIFAFLVLKIRFVIALITVCFYSIIYTFSFLLYPVFSDYITIFCLCGVWLALLILALIGYHHDQTERELFLSKRTIDAQNQKLKEEYVTINRQNKTINDSITYARTIQDSMLPSVEFVDSVLEKYFIFYKPLHIVSGDFYWVTKRNNLVVVVVADCSGHGVPGAFLSILGGTLLNELVHKCDLKQPHILLNNLKDKLVSTLRDKTKNPDVKDGIDMAFCVLDKEKNELFYSGSYHPLYLVRNGELIEIPGDRIPIGHHSDPLPSFTKHSAKLISKDTIYLCSDGYQDQYGGERGKKFMKRRFKQLLLDLQDHAIEDQEYFLSRILEEWKGEYEQIDDILVIGIRI